MSLENVRTHWKALAVIALVFILVALAGPLVFYGIPMLFGWMASTDSILLLLAFPVLIVGWIFGALWIGWKVNERPVPPNATDPTSEKPDG